MQGAGTDDSGTVTLLLREMRAGDRGAFEDLFRRIHHDLRRFAQSILREHTYSAESGTELVNMACSRLLGRGPLEAENRAHLFFLLGRAMRDALVEEARRRSAAARGGGVEFSPLIDIAVDDRTERINVFDMNEALAELAGVDPAGSKVIELRYFAGLTLDQTAEALGVSLAKVRSDWDYARAWLAERLSHGHRDV